MVSGSDVPLTTFQKTPWFSGSDLPFKPDPNGSDIRAIRHSHRPRVIPDFTTTTSNDRIAASVAFEKEMVCFARFS